MASLAWPWDPIEPEEDGRECRVCGGPLLAVFEREQGHCDRHEAAYDPYAEQDKTPTERMYDEMNREEGLDGLA